MGDWERLVESVSIISNFVITGDGILGWEFVIYGKLGKVDRRSLNNQQLCDNRGWEIGIRIFDRCKIEQG